MADLEVARSLSYHADPLLMRPAKGKEKVQQAAEACHVAA